MRWRRLIFPLTIAASALFCVMIIGLWVSNLPPTTPWAVRGGTLAVSSQYGAVQFDYTPTPPPARSAGGVTRYTFSHELFGGAHWWVDASVYQAGGATWTVIEHRGVRIDDWLLLIVGGLPAVVALLLRARARRRRDARSRAGLCPECGYDLRATPKRCPECGNVSDA